MIKKVKETLEPSDVVIIRGTVYRADMMDASKPCRQQCHLYNHLRESCCGYCYRWENTGEIVFRELMPAALLGENAIVCVTKTTAQADKDLQKVEAASLKNAKYYQNMKK